MIIMVLLVSVIVVYRNSPGQLQVEELLHNHLSQGPKAVSWNWDPQRAQRACQVETFQKIAAHW